MIARQIKANLPTKWGHFNIYAFSESHEEPSPDLALVHVDIDKNSIVAVRIHSECITGDLFGSKRCDCGDQLDMSMKLISEQKGMLIYLRQEGRGIGLINKLEAYNLQDNGLDTFEANVHLGFEPDDRDFNTAVDIMNDLGIKKIDLITNNPEKIAAIESSSIILNSRIPIIIPTKKENERYMKAKQTHMGHLL
ncbi:MAG: GTP cyclohydrolase II [Saprospiraceae bacterium]|nr:GTP cyclohydrolase II [Saprospiraceae bacterium]